MEQRKPNFIQLVFKLTRTHVLALVSGMVFTWDALFSNERIEVLNIRKNSNCVDGKYSCPVNRRSIESFESRSIMKTVIEQGNFRWNIFYKHPVYHLCILQNWTIWFCWYQWNLSHHIASIILKHNSIRLSPILSICFLLFTISATKMGIPRRSIHQSQGIFLSSSLHGSLTLGLSSRLFFLE